MLFRSDVNVDFDAGSRRDPAGKAGTATLTNGMLARGIREASISGKGSQTVVEPIMTEAEISNALADVAAQRGGGPGTDRSGMAVRTLSSAAERDQSVLILARLLAQPSMPEEFFQRDKARTIAAIRESLTKPESIADKAFWRLAYGSHPYGTETTVETVEAITRDDLLDFHRRHYVANHAVISMIGDISREQAHAIAIELTRRLPQGESLAQLPAVAPSVATEQRIPHPASQSHVLMGMPTLSRGDPDFFPLTVGNYILGGGGFVSRIAREVREQRGLAYSSYSYFSAMAQPGPYQAGLQTRKDQTDEALKVVRDTIATFLRDGPTEAELKAAKDNLIGGFPLRIDNNRKILENLATIGYYRLPLDYLETWIGQVGKVSIADIRAAFARKLSLARMVTVVVGAEQ